VPDEPVLDPPLLVRYRLDRDDMAEIARRVRPGEVKVIGGGLAVAVAVLGVLVALRVPALVVVGVAIVAAAVLGRAVAGTWRGRRRAIGLETTLTFSSAGIEYAWGDEAGSVPWAGLEPRPTERLTVLVREGRPVVAVPHRYLTDADRAAIAAWVGGAADGPQDAVGQPDAVHETEDGGIVVSGVVTASRAREGRQGMVRPWVRRTGNVLVALVLVVVWGRVLLGRGTPSTFVGLLTATAGVALVAGLVQARQAAREARQLGGLPVRWHLTRDGLDVSGSAGSWSSDWSSVRGAMVHGEMLVLRRRGGPSVAVLVGPLSPEQRRRVFGWVEAGSGRRVHAAR
jgi:hypothetical protein